MFGKSGCACSGDLNATNTLVGPAAGTIDLSTFGARASSAATPTPSPVTANGIMTALIVALIVAWVMKG